MGRPVRLCCSQTEPKKYNHPWPEEELLVPATHVAATGAMHLKLQSQSEQRFTFIGSAKLRPDGFDVILPKSGASHPNPVGVGPTVQCTLTTRYMEFR